MRLTGKQVEALAEFADGTDVAVNLVKGSVKIAAYRYEDEKRISIADDGAVTPMDTLTQARGGSKHGTQN